MRKSFLLALLAFLLASCSQKDPNTPDWAFADRYYLKALQQAISGLEKLQQVGGQDRQSKKVFIKLRREFKKSEPYVAYLNPSVAHRVNGPALPIFQEDNSRILSPVGLQRLEETVFGEEYDSLLFQKELSVTLGMMRTLEKGIKKRPMDSSRFFISTHQQLMRIVSLGISGFDTPVSQLGVEEAAVSLQSLLEVYQNTLGHLVRKRNPELHKELIAALKGALHFIRESPDFEAFDRYTFIRNYLNPITRSWVKVRNSTGLWAGSHSYSLNFEAPTFFEHNTFNTRSFLSQRSPSDKQIVLGKKLFFDKNLSTSGILSCATCHVPQKAYTDGLATGIDKDGVPLPRNTPTLLNSVYQRNFFWDGRSDDLDGQIREVFTNKREFDIHTHLFSKDLLADTAYIRLFTEAYGVIPNQNSKVIEALAAYVSTLQAFNSKFDRNMRGEEETFTEDERVGMNLFMGKALCATCHFIPLTNGTVPPFFEETEREVIGVPNAPDNQEFDDDYGFHWRFPDDLHKGMFKTPTVRNATLTAPYMHNGVYHTLDEVMDFYNKGGGVGLGFDLPYQTLPFDSLSLTKYEMDALVAFVSTLSDTTLVVEY